METTENLVAAAGRSVDAEGWLDEFDNGFAAIAGRFGRVEPRRQARAFLLGLRLPTVSISPEEARDYVGWLGGLWAVDGPASAQITRDLLGWQPAGPGLIADLQQGHYFS
ncbi:hypothetical protein ACIBF5_32265 [Micromonospora sp. NPDC050417]|uniref:hypothetical protein n=1 Tax=Micromonospora sp. NPDC050417 TaxID=3364280 RepID=UPI0037ACA447